MISSVPMKQQSRLHLNVTLVAIAMAALSWTGCDTFKFRGQSSDLEEVVVDIDDETLHFVGDISAPYGLSWAEIKSVGLITQLDQTGSAPAPSSMRDRLLNEMMARQVPNPKTFLEAKHNSLVIVQGFLPPGIKKGERIDIWVQIPSSSRTTNLTNGYLLPTRMRPMADFGSGLLTGHEVASARGSVLTESLFEEGSDTLMVRGRILGGGISNHDRSLGLMINSESAVATEARAINIAINKRFDTIEGGNRTGVAEAKANNKVELLIPRQYKHNLSRYLTVVGNIAFNEMPLERAARIEELEQQLNEPFLASRAAIRLEAIGLETVGVLKRALKSDELEVRFYAAETLAYLGQQEAASVLAEIAKDEYAFRWHALTALSSMDDVEAGFALSELLHQDSAETRYGAFRALQARSEDDPALAMQPEVQEFYYHTIASNSPPMVHISHSRREEIVLFGLEQKVSPDFVYAPAGLTIRSDQTPGVDQLVITRYLPREKDRKVTCSRRIDDLIRAVVELGGDYQTVVEMLRTVNNDGYLEKTRLVIDALPKPGRQRVRSAEPDGDADELGQGQSNFVAGPLPSLFRQATNEEIKETLPESDDDEEDEISGEESESVSQGGKKGFFSKLPSIW